jgi:hypothetical protein
VSFQDAASDEQAESGPLLGSVVPSPNEGVEERPELVGRDTWPPIANDDASGSVQGLDPNTDATAILRIDQRVSNDVRDRASKLFSIPHDDRLFGAMEGDAVSRSVQPETRGFDRLARHLGEIGGLPAQGLAPGRPSKEWLDQ